MFKLITLLPLALAAASSVCQPYYETVHALHKAHRTILRSANTTRRRLPAKSGEEKPEDQPVDTNDLEAPARQENEAPIRIEAVKRAEPANKKWSIKKKLAYFLGFLAIPTTIWAVGKLTTLPSYNADTKQPTGLPTQEPTIRKRVVKKYPTSWLDFRLDLLSEEAKKDLMSLQDEMLDFGNSCYLANNRVCNEGIECPMGTDCMDCHTCYYSPAYRTSRAVEILEREAKTNKKLKDTIDAMNA